MKKFSLMRICLFMLMLVSSVGMWADKQTATKTISAVVSEKSYTVSAGSTINTKCQSINLDENINVSISVKDGATGNTGSFWGTAPSIDWRLYQADEPTITVSAGDGYTISTVKFTYSNSNTGVINTTGHGQSIESANRIASGTAYNVNAASATYYVGNTSTKTNGQARITAIEVVYSSTSGGGSTPTEYTVTVANNISNGTVTANPTSAAAGATVTLTATPADGYKLGSWNVTNASTSAAITVTNNQFTMPAANVNVSATFTPITDKTIAEFIASEGGTCYLTGIVSNISNTTYGNFDLTDETGTIYIYGCLTPEGVKQQFNTLDVIAGDKIKVIASEYELYNEKEEAKNVIFVEEIAIPKTQYTVTIGTPENGTLVVKDGETVLVSGDQVEEGKTLTVECTPTDAENYRYQNWQYKEDGNWVTMTSTMTRVVTQDISIRANFELIPTYTIAWSVNGEIVKNEDLKEGAAVTAPDVEDADEKVFTGWVTTAEVDADETPDYVVPATTAAANATYYAVFASYNSEAAPAKWQTTTLANLTSSDVFVMANGTNAISSANGTSGNPAAVALTVSEGKITSEVTDAIKWQLSGNATDGYVFYKNGTTNYLYVNTTATSGSNTCIRVGTQVSNVRNNWKPDNNGNLKTNDSYTARYLSFYSTGSDFRGYINTSNGAFAPTFYKFVAGEDPYSNFSTTVAAGLVAPTIVVETTDLELAEEEDATRTATVSEGDFVGTITYTSSDEDEEVIMIDEDYILAVGPGSATITVTATPSDPNDAKYKATSVSYNVIVRPEGKAIVAEYNGKYYAATTTIDNKALVAQRVRVMDGIVINAANESSLTWYVTGNTYMTYNNEYLSAATNSTSLALQAETASLPDCSRELLYSNTNGAFKFYASSNIGGSDYSTSIQLLPFLSLDASDYTHTRSTNVDEFGTICLPYKVVADDIEGATFYSIAGKITEDGVVTNIVLEEQTSLTAGTPYIFQATASTVSLAYSGDEATVAGNANGLYGTFVRYPFADDANYDDNYYVVLASEIQAASVNSGVNANRAYIKMNEVPVYSPTPGAKVRVIALDGSDVTGIKAIATSADETIFNLAGQRVNNAQKGIYIKNGRKYIVK